MIIDLVTLPDTLHGPDDPSYHGKVPHRARYLAPDAARSLLAIDAGLVYTDIFRSPQAQREAYHQKVGVQRPGYSGHGYGLAVDLDVGATLRQCKMSYPQLIDLMQEGDWHCHRRDLDPRGHESWHFNYGVGRYLDQVDPQDPNTWSLPAELNILARYGDQMHMEPADIQAALAAMNLNVIKFQMAWSLRPDGIAGPKTQR